MPSVTAANDNEASGIPEKRGRWKRVLWAFVVLIVFGGGALAIILKAAKPPFAFMKDARIEGVQVIGGTPELCVTSYSIDADHEDTLDQANKDFCGNGMWLAPLGSGEQNRLVSTDTGWAREAFGNIGSSSGFAYHRGDTVVTVTPRWILLPSARDGEITTNVTIQVPATTVDKFRAFFYRGVSTSSPSIPVPMGRPVP